MQALSARLAAAKSAAAVIPQLKQQMAQLAAKERRARKVRPAPFRRRRALTRPLVIVCHFPLSFLCVRVPTCNVVRRGRAP
jgi:hypothetical protein